MARSWTLLALAFVAVAAVAACNRNTQQGTAAPSSGVADYLPGQKTCPVSGQPIDKSIFVDYEGKRVYFCCKACPGAFKKDPQKYLAKLAPPAPPEAAEMAGPATQPAEVVPLIAGQETCPVSGQPINKELFVDYKGKRVYFCCGSCPAAFNKDPDKFVGKMLAEARGPTTQPSTQPEEVHEHLGMGH